MATPIVIGVPETVLAQIFECLDGPSLLQVERTCPLWRSVCVKYDEQIWHTNVLALWSVMKWNRAAESLTVLFERIKKLSIAKLKKSLVAIDLSRCVEKIDFQRLLQAHLVFYPNMRKQLSGSDPRFAGKYLTMNYPDWALAMRVHKASYYFTVRELKRKEMFLSELCAVEWVFRFKNNEHLNGQWKCKFNEDFTMNSDMGENHTYTWRVISSGEESAPLCVQVDHYPVLTATRILTPKSRGQWRLDNIYVYFLQSKDLDGESLPLF